VNVQLLVLLTYKLLKVIGNVLVMVLILCIILNLYHNLLDLIKLSLVLLTMPLGMLISGVLDLVLKELLLLNVNVLLTVFRSKKLHGINGVIVTTDSMKMITLIVVYQLLIQLLIQ
jgi:hypothetical protein